MKVNRLVCSARLSAYHRNMAHVVLIVLVNCVFIPAAFASAPGTNGHSSWQAVVSLPVGIKVDVKVDMKGRSQHIHCDFASADEKTLTCTRSHSGTPFVLDRNQIRSIKIGHRVRSALIGAGIGGASLGIAGFAVTTGGGDSFFGPNFLRGQVTGLSALTGGILGGGIGAFTDFSKSTVYSAR